MNRLYYGLLVLIVFVFYLGQWKSQVVPSEEEFARYFAPKNALVIWDPSPWKKAGLSERTLNRPQYIYFREPQRYALHPVFGAQLDFCGGRYGVYRDALIWHDNSPVSAPLPDPLYYSCGLAWGQKQLRWLFKSLRGEDTSAVIEERLSHYFLLNMSDFPEQVGPSLAVASAAIEWRIPLRKKFLTAMGIKLATYKHKVHGRAVLHLESLDGFEYRRLLDLANITDNAYLWLDIPKGRYYRAWMSAVELDRKAVFWQAQGDVYSPICTIMAYDKGLSTVTTGCFSPW
jgi:hypothetical protein